MTTTEKPQGWYKTQGILGTTFKTKKAITEAVRAIINPCSHGDTLVGNGLDFMLELLTHHPEWSEKQGVGVRSVQVRLNVFDHGANKGVWLIRVDGSEIDISWVYAIAAVPPTYHKQVRDAARHAIYDQIQHVRDSAGLRGRCQICQLQLDGETHVDHAAPATFEAIFAAWHAGRPDVTLRDTGLHPVFADAVLLADWQEHHRLFSDLRLVHKHCNLSTKGASK